VNHVVTVTWDDVGYFGSHTNKLNAFQLQLIGLGNGDFQIVFRYEDINWTTGDASGGTNGLGGSAARAGYTSGNPDHAFQLSQSGDQNGMLALETTLGNTGIAGVYSFQVSNGTVSVAPVANGTILFEDPDDNDVHTVAVMAEGADYLGSFAADAPDQGAQSVAWHFTLASNEVDQFFNSAAAEVREQNYSITIQDAGLDSVTQQVRLAWGAHRPIRLSSGRILASRSYISSLEMVSSLTKSICRDSRRTASTISSSNR